MDYASIDSLRERHAAWRLLRAGNASLILSFLGRFFVEGNRGATAANEVANALDDDLYTLNATLTTENGEPRFPKTPKAYLEDWSATESRLHTAVELLRQIVHGSEVDPESRLTELRRRRDEIDREIAAVEAGEVAMLDPTGIRDRYQQFSATARDLLSDFREVEENFRGLDRAARERIAAWEGSKGDLLVDLVGSRSDIAGSDQGRSFLEPAALALRDRPPTHGLDVDEPGLAIALPFERPLYDARPSAEVESLIPPSYDAELDTDLLFNQTFVDQTRLADNIRAVVPPRSSALLDDIVQLYPITQGAAEIISYLSLQDDGLEVEMDDTGECLIDYEDPTGQSRRARLPKVTVRRRWATSTRWALRSSG